MDCKKDQKQDSKSQGNGKHNRYTAEKFLETVIETNSCLGLTEIRIFKLKLATIDLFLPFFQWMANLVPGKHTRRNAAATVEEESGFDSDFVTIRNQHMEGKVVQGLLLKL